MLLHTIRLKVCLYFFTILKITERQINEGRFENIGDMFSKKLKHFLNILFHYRNNYRHYESKDN